MLLSDQELLFFNMRPHALPLYLLLREALCRLCGTMITVRKTQITFAAPKGYCVVSHPRSAKAAPCALMISLSLPYPLSHALLIQSVPIRHSRWTCHLLVSSENDLQTIYPLIEEAYHTFGCSPKQ